MKNNHTPKPWILIDKKVDGAFQIVPVDPGGMRICTVTNAHNDEANSRLISAAPSMYEALKAVIADAGEDGYGPLSQETILAVIQAKDEAEGRTL